MSTLVEHQQTCPVCVKSLLGMPTDLEPLIDPVIRYIAVHCGCSTFVHRKPEAAPVVLVVTS